MFVIHDSAKVRAFSFKTCVLFYNLHFNSSGKLKLKCVSVLKEDQGLDYLQVSKEIARILHSRNDIEGAKVAIKEAMEKFPNCVESAGWQSLNIQYMLGGRGPLAGR